jgi:hypothetical protein
MSDALRASLYAFNLIQKKRKKVEGAPKPALARKITKVGVVGAGLMASQLALLFVRNLKCPVVMTDIDQVRADKGVAWVRAELAKLVEKRRMSQESADRLSALISGSADQSVFAGCDFVIEAIFEELSLKQELFKNMFVGILLYSVVLGFFNDYTDILHTKSYSTTFSLAIVLQILTYYTLAFKDIVKNWYKNKNYPWGKAGLVFVIWLIIFFSKFIFLAIISFIFKEYVTISGFIGLLIIIICLMRRIYICLC